MSAKNSVELLEELKVKLVRTPNNLEGFLKDTQQQLKAYGVPEGIASLIIVQCMNATLSKAQLYLEKN